MARFTQNGQLQIIETTDHRYSEEGDFQKMVGLISGFLIVHSQ